MLGGCAVRVSIDGVRVSSAVGSVRNAVEVRVGSVEERVSMQ